MAGFGVREADGVTNFFVDDAAAAGKKLLC